MWMVGTGPAPRRAGPPRREAGEGGGLHHVLAGAPAAAQQAPGRQQCVGLRPWGGRHWGCVPSCRTCPS